MVRLMRSMNPNNTNRFKLDFMQWDTFRDAMLDHQYNTQTWLQIIEADCLIGGIDTSLSYMYVFNLTKYKKY
jgi:hypothetical protein